ncbi:hypothetical protein PEQA60_34890 [Pseudomonas sp. Eqa60]|jgi:uncharacterized protein (DUF2345 family)|uniref:hypothetical protein n=1 Tax=Pseudomonas TaxID=286 RepID=UPI0005A25E88|nr:MULTISPECIES: hypothetical protein [Pseudomonas]MBP5112189.1 hypothetical protein [Pseudomonas protegens]QTU23455.1 hypothetical protein HUT21_03580 [Pseudomonas protegens]QTU32987.1 hypothetical protein HUT20_21485 [Pseudomonas protegens]RLO21885.1 hypothetical protein EAG75_18035 [Pseudomonas protegens]VAV69644.1 hypothetical protein PPRCHA0_3342 [Pseudomonas protegens CHA0]
MQLGVGFGLQFAAAGEGLAGFVVQDEIMLQAANSGRAVQAQQQGVELVTEVAVEQRKNFGLLLGG